MGKVRPDGGAVRYVSPVTARLFSKAGSQALGLHDGEVLAPLAGSGNSINLLRGPVIVAAAKGERMPIEEKADNDPEAAPPPSEEACDEGGGGCGDAECRGRSGAGGGGGMVRQRRVEVVRASSTSPVNGAGVTCPQAYLESILREAVSAEGGSK